MNHDLSVRSTTSLFNEGEYPSRGTFIEKESTVREVCRIVGAQYAAEKIEKGGTSMKRERL